MQLLSIDAIREADGGWSWNQWFKAGDVPQEHTTTPRKLLTFLRRGGWLRSSTTGKLAVEDDGYNLVVVSRHTAEPLYAVVYGDTEVEDTVTPRLTTRPLIRSRLSHRATLRLATAKHSSQ